MARMSSRPTSGHRPPQELEGAYCEHFHRAVELIGKRWTGAIVRVLEAGPRRFSEIASAVPGLSDRLLSARLKQLESEGILDRRVTSASPVRIDYLLTDKGRALQEITAGIAHWAHEWGAPSPSALRGPDR